MIELLVLLAFGVSPGAEQPAPNGLQLSGDALCPSAIQIAQSLARLHPDLDARGWQLELSAGASDLQMRVRDPANALVGERRFVGLASCDQRAEAVAATLAVWLGDLAAQPLPTPLYPTPITEQAPPEATSPTALAVRGLAPTASMASSQGWQLELGAGALGSIDETGAGAPGVDLSAWVRPVARRWGLQAHLDWEAPRTLPLGPSFVDWQRVTLGAGPHFLLERGWRGFELEADLVAGVAVTQGRGLSVPRLDAAIEPGLFVGARFFADPQPVWRGWLSVGLALWPLRQQVGLFAGTTSTPTALATLPQLEVVLALGGSWLD